MDSPNYILQDIISFLADRFLREGASDRIREVLGDDLAKKFSLRDAPERLARRISLGLLHDYGEKGRKALAKLLIEEGCGTQDEALAAEGQRLADNLILLFSAASRPPGSGNRKQERGSLEASNVLGSETREECGKLIIDNWTMETLTSVYQHGVSDLKCAMFSLDGTNRHYWQRQAQGGVQTEALLTLLTEIVLREQLVTEGGFSNWPSVDTPIIRLIDEGVVQFQELQKGHAEVFDVKKRIVSELCITDSMRLVQKKNEESWRISKSAADPLASQVFWGTAGFLARSHVNDIPYSGFPVRRAFLKETIWSKKRSDSVGLIHKWVDSERARVFSRVMEHAEDTEVKVILPPIAVEVIEESRDASQLIPVAIELRGKYKKLREWLSKYQMALRKESPRELLGYRRQLEGISRQISDEFSIGADGKLGYELRSLHLLEGSDKENTDVSAILSDMVLEKSGRDSLRKLLSMFDIKGTVMEMEVFGYLEGQGIAR